MIFISHSILWKPVYEIMLWASLFMIVRFQRQNTSGYLGNCVVMTVSVDVVALCHD